MSSGRRTRTSKLLMNALSIKNKKLLFPICLFVLALIGYLPTLMALPRMDEIFQMQWLQSCFQSGLFTQETAHYLFSQAREGADNQGLGPRLVLLIFAAISLFNLQIAHFLLVSLHACNASLFYFLVKKLILTVDQEKRDKIAHGFTAVVAGSLYLFSPLAVEPVSWLSGASFVLANTAILLSANFLFCRTKFVAGAILLPVAQLFAGKYLMCGLVPIFLLCLSPAETFKVWSKREKKIFSLSVIFLLLAFAINLITCTGLTPPIEGRMPPAVSRILALFVPVPRASLMPTLDHTLLSVLPLLATLGLILSRKVSSFLPRWLGLVLVYIVIFTLTTDNFAFNSDVYGARWMHGALPVLSLFLSLLFTAGYYLHKSLLKDNLRLHIYREMLTGALALAMIGDCLYITLYQCQKVNARGKLFKTIMTRVKKLAPQTTSPYLLLRDLPRELTLAPLLPTGESLFAMDKQDGMPVSGPVAVGPSIDNLRAGKSVNNMFRYSSEFTNLAPLDFTSVPASLPSWFDAKELSRIMTPPMSFSKGAITYDAQQNMLTLVGREKAGAALGIEDLQISPIQTDCFCLDATVDGQIDSTIELHWLTNFYKEWDGHGRHLLIKTSKSDNGLKKRFVFNLRQPTWLSNGFITDFMVGLPANATVKLEGMGFLPASSRQYLPTKLTCQAKLPQSNKRHFTPFCKNYPDTEDLGLTACYGQDNALEIKAQAASMENSEAVKRIRVTVSRTNQTGTDKPGEVLKSLDCAGDSCQTTISLADLKVDKDTVLTVQAESLNDTGSPVGLSSDPVYVLVSKKGKR